MKKILVLAGALLLANNLQAEENINYGVKWGGSVATIHKLGDLVGDKSPEFGKARKFMTAGAYGKYMIDECFGVNVGLLYGQLGKALTKKEEDKDVATKCALTHNLLVPVTVEWCPMGCDNEDGVFSMNLGVQPIVLLGANDGTEKGEEVKDTFVPVTANGIFSMGYEHPSGFSLELGASLGYFSTFQKDKTCEGCTKEDSNHMATLTLGCNLAKVLEEE